MKRYWVYVLLSISLLFNASIIAGAWFQASRTGAGVERSFFGMDHDRVPDHLKLDPAQRAHWQAMERDFVKALHEASGEIGAHRERMVREIFSAQPEDAVIERERAAIFALQEAQQRTIIAQLRKEGEILRPEQRAALAELLLAQAVGVPDGR